MRISTKVVWDIATGKILQRESYEYQGPLALCTNVTAPTHWSNEGAYIVEVKTSGTFPGGVDMLGGSFGAQLELDGGVPCFELPKSGNFGTQRLTDGTHILAYFSPSSWGDADWNFVSDTPNAPPVVTGWGLLLGQHRDRLVWVGV